MLGRSPLQVMKTNRFLPCTTGTRTINDIISWTILSINYEMADISYA